MNRHRLLAIALVASLPTTAHAQATVQQLLEAHSRTSVRKDKAFSDNVHYTDWNAYSLAGWRAINKGYYDIAAHEFLSAIKVARRPGFDDTRLIAKSYADYAWALQLQGRNAEAEPLAKWALIARQATLEATSPLLAQSLNQLATLYLELGRHSDAEPLLRRAIDLQEKSPQPNLQEHARSRTLMGLLLVAQRRYAEAEPFFEKAVELRQTGLGPTHPETGDALSNLAWAYQEQGKGAEALPLFETALKIVGKTRGESDPSVAHTLGGLGQVLAKQGRTAEAEEDYRRAIAVWEKWPGEEVALLEVLRHYAELLEQQGRAEELANIKARMASIKLKLTTTERRPAACYRLPGQTSTAVPTLNRMPG